MQGIRLRELMCRKYSLWLITRYSFSVTYYMAVIGGTLSLNNDWVKQRDALVAY